MEKPTKKQILKIAEEYPSHLTHKIKKRWPKFYEHVNETVDGSKFTERIYVYLYGKGECEVCGNPTRFDSFTKGYKRRCSRKCAATKLDAKETAVCPNCEVEFEYYKCDPRKYCSHECYTEYETKHGLRHERLAKGREKVKEKYGSMGFGSEEIAQKSYDTLEERYGDKHYNNREKERRTKLKRYGDEEYNNREKYRETCLEKYGKPYYNAWRKAAKSRNERKYKQLINNKKFNEKIVPLFDMEDYTGIEYYKTYPFRCVQCEHEFEDWLNNGNVPRCPECYPRRGSSFVEKEIVYYVQSLLPDDEVIENDRSVLESGELDIYIPSKQIAIEYNGLYWHSEKNGNKDRYYHVSKTEECLEKGIQLIHIFEDEWINSGYIVKSALKHMLGLTKETIYARKCEVDYVTKEVGDHFLTDTHLQGKDNSSVRLGLYHEDELVALMTFGSLRRALGSEPKENQWELVRFATSKHVVGGAGKLLAHFIREYEPKKIVTYADRRWSTGNLYHQLGFEEIHKTRPNYWYIENGNRVHRYSFRKSRLEEKLDYFDPELTEWQNMQLNDYDRIWDCGHIRFEWNG